MIRPQLIKKNLTVPKISRYFILGEASEKIKKLWFVCHGYAQAADRFILEFEPLAAGDMLIVAPEGFHRFYVKGFSGNVGASWMTKEDRMDDIADYVSYLDRVYEEIMKSIPSDVQFNVLGFSQGAATVCRWLCRAKAKAANLVLWGGGIPPDTLSGQDREILNRLNIRIVIGDKDEFISDEQVKSQLSLLKENEIRFDFLPYHGAHGIQPDVLREIINV